ETEARILNAPYMTLVTQQRPFVHAKWAMSLDGKIATACGESKWISGEESRRLVHQLRGRMDAIVVGARTVRADDPQLTARPSGPRIATRIVLSRTGVLPRGCKLLQTAKDVPVVITGSQIADAQRRTLEAHGCEVLTTDLPGLLHELGKRRFTNVLVEGGSATLGSFRDAELIDEVHVFVAPLLLGGSAALSPVGGAGAAHLADGLKLTDWSCERSGRDWYIHG